MSPEMQELITYSVTDAALAEMRRKYLGLRVHSVDDAEGYALCKEARQAVRRKRIEVEDRRKELKAESLEFGRAIDAEAKRIRAQIEEVESHLVSQLQIVEEERKRREEEALRSAIGRLASSEATEVNADSQMLADIKAQFPTLETAWAEIARLRKLLGK